MVIRDKKDLFEIKYFDSLESTNLYAKQNEKILVDKDVIVANSQTNGKGRLNRKWYSNSEGNVYLSIVLKPDAEGVEDLPLANLTQYMCVVLCRIFQDYGIEASIKWPNDILIDGKKISGILSEALIQGTSLKCFILGVGINLNLSQSDVDNIDQPATSLNLLLNTTINRDLFISQFLNEFFKGYDAFLQGGFLSIKEEYEAQTNFIGKRVTISGNEFWVQSVNDDGTLKVIDNNQQEKDITIGDLVCQ